MHRTATWQTARLARTRFRLRSRGLVPAPPPLGTRCKAQETVVEGEAFLVRPLHTAFEPSPLSWCSGEPTRAFTGSLEGTRTPEAINPPAGAFPTAVAPP